MKIKKNEIINRKNHAWINRNPKLLLYHKDRIIKSNSCLAKTQKMDLKKSKEMLIDKTSIIKSSKENSFNNKIQRPFSSNLRQKIFNNINNSTNAKNNLSMNLTNNSFNIASKQQYLSNIEKKLYQLSSSFHNKNQSIKFKMYNNTNISSTQNLMHFGSRNSNITNSKYILDSQKDNISFEKIRSLRNLNMNIVPSLKSKSKKDIFRKIQTSKSLSSKNLISKNLTNKNFLKSSSQKKIKYSYLNKVKNNVQDLILYKTVFYSACPQKGVNDELFKKLRKYNEEIRIRNDKKNIDFKIQEKPTKKRYYFYQYKEYMEKIEKEEINAYKSYLQKKQSFNIREIFKNKKDKKILSKKEIQTLSNKTYGNYSSNNTHTHSHLSKYARISLKKSAKNLHYEDNNSSSEIPMIINNYEIKKTGIRKLRRNKTMSHLDRKIILNRMRNNYSLNNSDESLEYSQENLSAQINKIKNLDLVNFKLNSGETPEKKNKTKSPENNKIKPDSSKKNGVGETEDKELFEILKKKYFQKRENLIKINRRNLLAQKLFFQKISELDKRKKFQQRNRFTPFFNLNYKHKHNAPDTESQNKTRIINKYYQKNLSKNQFSVRLKSKSGMSFISNNSCFSSQMYFAPNEQKNEYFNLKDYLNDDITQKNVRDLDKYDIIKKDDGESIFDLNEIEKIDNQINFNETKEEKENYFLNKMNKKDKNKLNEKKSKIKIDEEKLNKMIKEEKRKKFEKEYFKKYELLIKAREKKEEQKLNNPAMMEKVKNNFMNLLEENDNIIKAITSTKNENQANLFIEFKEKMNSLAKYSKKELDLFIYRNIPIINNILDECKRARQTEKRINHFIRILREDLDEIYSQREIILRYLKVLDYYPFS